MNVLHRLAQSDYMYNTNVTTTGSTDAGVSAFMLLIYLAVIVVMLVSMWKLFEKAGEEGWKAIVPFYNTYTLFRIAGRNGWGFLLALIPFVNIVVAVVVSLDLAKHFGKSTVFAIFGLILFPFVGYPMLAFGDVQYLGPKHD